MVGTSLGRYDIRETVGHGGVGTVYKALDTHLDRAVALKVLHPELASDPECKRRFHRGARAAAKLSHLNIVSVHDLGWEDGQYYIAMEYVRGENIAEILKREGNLPADRAIGIAMGICRALDHAHRRNIVHRDIKPENILVSEEGAVKVMDFGLAKSLDLSDVTQEGSVLGTAHYLSPEQASGENVDGRSDLYSLGVLLYEMLTGQVPFEGEDLTAVIYKHLNEQPIPLRELDLSIPPQVEGIVLRLLEKDPDRRYPSAGDLLTDLEGFKRWVSGEGNTDVRHLTSDLRPRGRFLSRLVGRERELGLLKMHLDLALSGEGGFILLVGEAGIGKTRLAEELHLYANERNAHFLSGRCTQGAGADPYGPFVDTLRAYFGIEASDPDALKERKIGYVEERFPLLGDLRSTLGVLLLSVGERPGEVLRPDERASRKKGLFHSVAQFLVRASRKRPLVLFIDDLHWADGATLEMLDYVVRQIGKFRILLIGAYRPEDLSEDADLPRRVRRLKNEDLCEMISLGRLTEEHVTPMVESFFGRADLPQEFIGQLYRQTEGNPLFVLETLKLMRDRGVVEKRDGLWRLAEGYDESAAFRSPSIVYDVLSGRLERLSEEDRALLECASVEGETFSSEALSAVLTIERMDLLRRLSELERAHQIIHSRGRRYQFDHIKIRDVLYNELSEELRREYHRRIGEFRENRHRENPDPVLFELAHHFYTGGEERKALPYLIRAGDRARSLYAGREALGYYDRALKILDRIPGDTLPQRIDLHESLGDVCYSMGKLAEAIEHYTDLLAWCADRAKRADVKRRIGWAYQQRHESALAFQYLREAARELGEDDRSLGMARIYLDTAMVYRLDSLDYEKAFEFHRKALEILKGTDNLKELARAYRGLGYYYATKGGEWDKGSEYLQKSLKICQEAGDEYETGMTYIEFLCQAFKSRGDFDGAIECAKKAIQIFDKGENAYWTAISYSDVGTSYKYKGDFTIAAEYFRKAVEISEEEGYPFPLVGCLANLGRICEIAGDGERAIEYLRRGVERALDFGQRNFTVSMCLSSCLRRLERVSSARGRRETFVGFCRKLRAERGKDIEKVGLVQWWLEGKALPGRPGEEVLLDTFEGEKLSSGWSWRADPKDPCGYEVGCRGGELEIRARRDHPVGSRDPDSHRAFSSLHMDPACLLREVSGDFAGEVEIGKAPDMERVGGLVVWRDRANYVILAVDDRDELYFYGRGDGEPRIVGRGHLTSRIHYLRIERREDRLSAWCRADNVDWGTCGELTFKMEDPVFVGMHAHCPMTLESAAVRYGYFKVERLESLRTRRITEDMEISLPGEEQDLRFSLRSPRLCGEHLTAPSSGSEGSGMDTLPLPQEQLATLCTVSRIVNSTLDLRELLGRAIDLMIETTGARRGLVILVDGKTGDLEVKVGRGVEEETIEDATRISRGIVTDVLGSARPIISLDAKTDPRFKDHGSVRLYDIRSVLCVPLSAKGRIIGTVYLDHPGRANAFSPEDSAFFEAVGDQIALAIENARLHERLMQENVHLRREVERIYRFPNLVGTSPRMQEVFELLEKVIPTSVTVLIEGETGTGKELVARAIHYNGPRKEKKFLAQSCAALPDELLESELFGHRKGSFTGAIEDKRGLFEAADGGTLFLDEIADASPSVQVKLLRALEEGEIRRVGETEPRKVDVRIIAASNRDLEEEIKAGRFREDLYYRLNVFSIGLPPLRKRREDIPLLAMHFLDRHCEKMGKQVRGFASEAMDLLGGYAWPGNVRELENEIERAVALCEEGDLIGPEVLSERIRGEGVGSAVRREGSFKEMVEKLERQLIEDALRANDGNRTKAAEQLGMSRRGLLNKMGRYGIERSLKGS